MIIVFFEIILLLYKLKPNILHLVTIQPILLGGIAARFIGINKIVYAISGIRSYFLSHNLKLAIRRQIILKSYRFALNTKRRIVIFSKSYRSIFCSQKNAHYQNQETIIIPGSGLDLKKFNYSKIPMGKPNVLMASRLLVSKGVYEFINAAKILKRKGLKINFQLVGKPDKSNPLTIKKV